MLTVLKKPLSRLIGNRTDGFVVTITEEGIRLRRFGHRLGCTYPWRALFTARAKTVAGLFDAPPPWAWLPNPGDAVWCPPSGRGRRPRYRRGMVTRVVDAIPEPLVFVKLRTGGVHQFFRSQTRPAGST